MLEWPSPLLGMHRAKDSLRLSPLQHSAFVRLTLGAASSLELQLGQECVAWMKSPGSFLPSFCDAQVWFLCGCAKEWQDCIGCAEQSEDTK